MGRRPEPEPGCLAGAGQRGLVTGYRHHAGAGRPSGPRPEPPLIWRQDWHRCHGQASRRGLLSRLARAHHDERRGEGEDRRSVEGAGDIESRRADRLPGPFRLREPHERDMPRRSVRLEQGFYYHVYNRGVDRGPTFLEPENYSFFLRRLRQFIADGTAEIIAYCPMPNTSPILVPV